MPRLSKTLDICSPTCPMRDQKGRLCTIKVLARCILRDELFYGTLHAFVYEHREQRYRGTHIATLLTLLLLLLLLLTITTRYCTPRFKAE